MALREKTMARKACDIDNAIETLFNKHLRMDPMLVINFMNACKTNDVGKLNLYLKEQNVSPYMTNDESQTPLIVAVINNSKSAALTLIKCKNSYFNNRDIYGHDALYYACINKNMDIIKIMLKLPNIKIDTVEGNADIMSDTKIQELFVKFADGRLKSLKHSKVNPREVEDNPQRQFRSSLMKLYGGCMVTAASPDDCDYIHICNPTKNKLPAYQLYNGLIISKEFYRKYYKKGLIKFNVDDIRQINENTIGVKLVTVHPEIMVYNGKEITFDIKSMKYFINNKPKPVSKMPSYKKGGKKKNSKMVSN